MLDARAIPRMRAFEKLESDGRLRRRGFADHQTQSEETSFHDIPG